MERVQEMCFGRPSRYSIRGSPGAGIKMNPGGRPESTCSALFLSCSFYSFAILVWLPRLSIILFRTGYNNEKSLPYCLGQERKNLAWLAHSRLFAPPFLSFLFFFPSREKVEGGNVSNIPCRSIPRASQIPGTRNLTTGERVVIFRATRRNKKELI